MLDTKPFQGVTILAIEDEPLTQELLQDTLEYAGGIITMVTTCEAALAVLSQQHFDVILSNIRLADGDGYTLMAQWRQQERQLGLVRTPAIALTAAVSEVNKAKAVTAGFQGFIAKPCDFNHLLSTVQAAMAIVGE